MQASDSEELESDSEVNGEEEQLRSIFEDAGMSAEQVG